MDTAYQSEVVCHECDESRNACYAQPMPHNTPYAVVTVRVKGTSQTKLRLHCWQGDAEIAFTGVPAVIVV